MPPLIVNTPSGASLLLVNTPSGAPSTIVNTPLRGNCTDRQEQNQSVSHANELYHIDKQDDNYTETKDTRGTGQGENDNFSQTDSVWQNKQDHSIGEVLPEDMEHSDSGMNDAAVASKTDSHAYEDHQNELLKTPSNKQQADTKDTPALLYQVGDHTPFPDSHTPHTPSSPTHHQEENFNQELLIYNKHDVLYLLETDKDVQRHIDSLQKIYIYIYIPET